MFLTTPLLAKGSFFGSLINKCRQVIKIKPDTGPSNNTHNNSKTTINVSPLSPTYTTPTYDETTTLPLTLLKTNERRPIAAANISVSSVSTTAKTVEEKAGLPPRPKKPLTPYFRFMQEFRPKILAENPKLNTPDLVRKISKHWETADPKLKERLLIEYKSDREKYVEQRAKYDSKITDQQREDIKQIKQSIADARERRMTRQRVKALGRPKKPASSFLRFLAEERVKTPQKPDQTYKDWHQKCTARWKSLSDQEKLPYVQTARNELDVYKKEIFDWEEKMMHSGHIDVVRHSSLIDPPEPKAKPESKSKAEPKKK